MLSATLPARRRVAHTRTDLQTGNRDSASASGLSTQPSDCTPVLPRHLLSTERLWSVVQGPAGKSARNLPHRGELYFKLEGLGYPGAASSPAAPRLQLAMHRYSPGGHRHSPCYSREPRCSSFCVRPPVLTEFRIHGDIAEVLTRVPGRRKLMRKGNRPRHPG